MNYHRDKICSTCRKKKSSYHFIGKGQDFLNCQSCRDMKKKKRQKARQQFLNEGRINLDRL